MFLLTDLIELAADSLLLHLHSCTVQQLPNNEKHKQQYNDTYRGVNVSPCLLISMFQWSFTVDQACLWLHTIIGKMWKFTEFQQSREMLSEYADSTQAVTLPGGHAQCKWQGFNAFILVTILYPGEPCTHPRTAPALPLPFKLSNLASKGQKYYLRNVFIVRLLVCFSLIPFPVSWVPLSNFYHKTVFWNILSNPLQALALSTWILVKSLSIIH